MELLQNKLKKTSRVYSVALLIFALYYVYAASGSINALVWLFSDPANALMRLGLPSNSPSAMQTRASCASKSVASKNCTGCVATKGRCRRSAKRAQAAVCSSSRDRPARCTSK